MVVILLAILCAGAQMASDAKNMKKVAEFESEKNAEDRKITEANEISNSILMAALTDMTWHGLHAAPTMSEASFEGLTRGHCCGHVLSSAPEPSNCHNRGQAPPLLRSLPDQIDSSDNTAANVITHLMPRVESLEPVEEQAPLSKALTVDSLGGQEPQVCTGRGTAPPLSEAQPTTVTPPWPSWQAAGAPEAAVVI